jgi:hypothetical protein
VDGRQWRDPAGDEPDELTPGLEHPDWEPDELAPVRGCLWGVALSLLLVAIIVAGVIVAAHAQ